MKIIAVNQDYFKKLTDKHIARRMDCVEELFNSKRLGREFAKGISNDEVLIFILKDVIRAEYDAMLETASEAEKEWRSVYTWIMENIP